MKKLFNLILLASLFSLASCGEHVEPNSISPSITYKTNSAAVSYIEVMEVEGCEYLIFKYTGTGGFAVVHKGNCPNQFHYSVSE